MRIKSFLCLLAFLLSGIGSYADGAWSEQNLRQLIAEYRAGNSPGAIARRLGKPESETKSKIDELLNQGAMKGWRLAADGALLEEGLGVERPWTDKETDSFVDLFSEGLEFSELSYRLNHSGTEIDTKYVELAAAGMLVPPVENDSFVVRFLGAEACESCVSNRLFRFEIRDKATGAVSQISTEGLRLGMIAYRMLLTQQRVTVLVQYPQIMAQSVAVYDIQARQWVMDFHAWHVSVSPLQDRLAFLKFIGRGDQTYAGDIVIGYDLRRSVDDNRPPVGYDTALGVGAPLYVPPSAERGKQSESPDAYTDNIASPLQWTPDGVALVFISSECDGSYLVKVSVERDSWGPVVRKRLLDPLEQLPDTLSEEQRAAAEAEIAQRKHNWISAGYFSWGAKPGTIVVHPTQNADPSQAAEIELPLP